MAPENSIHKETKAILPLHNRSQMFTISRNNWKFFSFELFENSMIAGLMPVGGIRSIYRTTTLPYALSTPSGSANFEVLASAIRFDKSKTM